MCVCCYASALLPHPRERYRTLVDPTINARGSLTHRAIKAIRSRTWNNVARLRRYRACGSALRAGSLRVAYVHPHRLLYVWRFPGRASWKLEIILFAMILLKIAPARLKIEFTIGNHGRNLTLSASAVAREMLDESLQNFMLYLRTVVGIHRGFSQLFFSLYMIHGLFRWYMNFITYKFDV